MIHLWLGLEQMEVGTMKQNSFQLFFPHGNIESRDQAFKSIQFKDYILSFLISGCPNESIVHSKVLISEEFRIKLSTNTLKIIVW